jgi:hypothetical protein
VGYGRGGTYLVGRRAILVVKARESRVAGGARLVREVHQDGPPPHWPVILVVVRLAHAFVRTLRHKVRGFVLVLPDSRQGCDPRLYSLVYRVRLGLLVLRHRYPVHVRDFFIRRAGLCVRDQLQPQRCQCVDLGL